MDRTPSKPAAASGGAGPAPFLLKTYDMVDDSITDEIVSWSSTRNSFVVWNPPEFARLLLPTYFKHNNFSSFIRQLNTYGFRKIDPERWEFANEDFVKDQKHLLKNINRKKPIHSHSNPQGSTIDPERAAFEEEIDKLTLQKNALEKSVTRFKHQQPGTKIQLEDLTQRVDSMEERQNNLLILLKKAVQNPGFVDLLAQKLESTDFAAYNKKRRLPSDDNSQMVPNDTFVPQFGNVFHDDFANKLKLELSSAVSDIILVSHSTDSSNEDEGSPQIRFSELCARDAQITPGGLPLAEKLKLSDTGTSFTFNMDSSSVPDTGPCEIPSLHTDEEAEGHVSCHLNLSLASCVSQVNASQSTDRMPQSIEEFEKPLFLSNDKNNEADFRVLGRNTVPFGENVTISSSHDPPAYQVPATEQAPANDVFWEQFLTEKPASLDFEEAISNFRKLQNHNL